MAASPQRLEQMTSQGTAHGRFARARYATRTFSTPKLRRAKSVSSRSRCTRVLLADADPLRFDRAIARWVARFILEAPGITADEAALALSAAKGLAGLKTRGVAGQTLRQLTLLYGVSGIVHVLQSPGAGESHRLSNLERGGRALVLIAWRRRSRRALSRRGPAPGELVTDSDQRGCTFGMAAPVRGTPCVVIA
jgi:hypothetical protein